MSDKSVKRCLFCYQPIDGDGGGYHPRCAKKLFGTHKTPILPYTRDNIGELALQVLEKSTSVTGVQPKLSLDINRGGKNEPDKFTIVGLWGNYILKPQSPKYDSMPELEDLTMKLAGVSGIATACHGLIMMDDGELAYVTRRMDRGDCGEKYSMLDMCQLTNRLTEHKYRGAYIQLAETIKRYSATPMLDVQRFWEIVLFSWLTGNSDMHCKNFSLIEKDDRGYQLSPAYDLLAVQLTGINDKDELAMPLVGYGVNDNETLSGFNRSSFVQAMVASGIAEGVAVKIIDKIISRTGKWDDVIDSSFLKDELKSRYKSLVAERKNRIVK
ncbi:MAG: HipA domain-containing protein [Bacteroidaceae bacterium]|nr:HipA domain-containing protein [Bacteroidaceae bacterium]